MRFVMPHGGYGLGNDLIPWAKGYILSRELGATLLHPAWGRNPRAYWRYFGTSRLDWQWYRVLVHVLPCYAFDEKSYREIGENDFAAACKVFAEKNQLKKKRAFIITITGLWGAFAGIETARHFVIRNLYNTRYTQENLSIVEQWKERDKLSIAVHIRHGDFRQSPPEGWYEGLHNTVLPIIWYMRVCDSIKNAIGKDNVQFLVASDAKRKDLAPLLDGYPCVFMSELTNSDCSDLIAMSEADLLICSLSTYSMWAAFLSEAPYIWFAPQLKSTISGRSISLIREFGIFKESSSDQAAFHYRGIPASIDGILPDYLLTYLRNRLKLKNPKNDLIRGGVIPL